MPEGSYELVQTADGVVHARISARGQRRAGHARRSTGARRSPPEERQELGLTGLLPSGVSTLDGQLRRVYAQYPEQADDLAKWVYLTNLRNRNEVLFYKLLTEHIEEMLPIVYTPTVGLAIEQFTNEFRRPRGVYLSVDHPEDVEPALRNTGLGADDVDLLVATDSEGILGIGDQGVGGIEISVGKLAVYTAAAGIHPSRVLPVVLDVGTDNLSAAQRRDVPGRAARPGPRRALRRADRRLRHRRARSCSRDAMLHWEDFGATNARRILNSYADQVCTFNDDMQGTAAVVLAAAFSAVRAAGVADARPAGGDPRRRHRRAGDRGHDARPDGPRGPVAARRPPGGSGRWAATGVLGDDRLEHLYDFQLPYARPWDEVDGLGGAGVGGRGWPTSCATCSPTMLIGTSTQAGAFTEQIVRDMAAHTAAADHHAAVQPDLQGRGAARRPARLDRRPGAGGHRQPVRAGRARRGRPTRSRRPTTRWCSPGSGWASPWRGRRGSPTGMIAAAADAVAKLSDATRPGAPLLPPVRDLRPVSAAVAIEVVARPRWPRAWPRPRSHNPIQQVHEAMWRPQYPRLETKPL